MLPYTSTATPIKAQNTSTCGRHTMYFYVVQSLQAANTSAHKPTIVITHVLSGMVWCATRSLESNSNHQVEQYCSIAHTLHCMSVCHTALLCHPPCHKLSGVPVCHQPDQAVDVVCIVLQLTFTATGAEKSKSTCHTRSTGALKQKTTSAWLRRRIHYWQ